MKWSQTAWQLIRDVLLTGTGLALIISQMPAVSPNSTLVVAGLALTVPAAATHATAVLSGPSTPPGPSSSSPSSPEHGEQAPPSSSPSTAGGTDD